MEERALQESRSLELKREELARRERALDDRERNIDRQADELKRARKVQRRELERLSSLTAAQAKQALLADVEAEARHLAGVQLRRIQEEAKQNAERRAKSILATAMQRLAGREAAETTTAVVALPSDDMKGRVIGREGRNIRTLEQLTGVDVIIDDTPSAVTLSCFDGVRRETARITLEQLVADGRINPASIEETFEQAKKRVLETIEQEGRRAVQDAEVEGLDDELVQLLGRLHYRTSFGQNVLDHLVECAELASMMAAELGASVETARRAALLHDIGKAVSHEVQGPHAEVGARIAARHGEAEAVTHGIAAHHDEVEPRTVEAVIVQAADAVSGARPGARGEALESFVERLRELERIAERQPGVDRVYAMRAGREIRVMVDPGKVSDEEAALIAHRISTGISRELEFPGRIRITVIRESRETAFAESALPSQSEPDTDDHELPPAGHV